MIDLDTVVIGGGAVGLSIAWTLAGRGHSVTILERHRQSGTETSARSSEVIHAGIYYPPGSLKARHCREGRDRLYAFCASEGIPFRQYGKLIVATTSSQFAALDTIARLAAANGVAGLENWTSADVRGREPDIQCAAALFSPLTGVVDSAAFIAALERKCLASSVTLALGNSVTSIERNADGTFALRAVSGDEETRLTVRRLVIAAGHGAAPLAREAVSDTGYSLPVSRQAKGHYYTLRGKHTFRTLIYPIPDSASLGIHLTLDVNGTAKFGPDIQWQDGFGLGFADADGARQRHFEQAIRQYWPGLPANALMPAYTGVRPKIHGPGEPPADFLIAGPSDHRVENLVLLLGIESPGLTAALAIGPYVGQILGGA